MADNETLPPGYHALSLAPEWLKSLASWDERKQAEDPGRLNMSPWRYDPAQRKSVVTAPKSLTGPVSGMATALMHMGDALQGVYFANEDQRGAVEDALNLAMTGMASGVVAPRGAVGMFAGAGSKSADKVALDAARNYESQGESKDAIWHATGWFRDLDNKWKYEIPDHEGMLDKDSLRPNSLDSSLWTLNGKQRLGDLLIHDKLFDAYPELQDQMVYPTPLNLIPKMRGAVQGDKMYLSPGNSQDMYSALLHETQHLIQDKEGFAQGGHMGEWWTPAHERALGAVEGEMGGIRKVANQLQPGVHNYDVDLDELAKASPELAQSYYDNASYRADLLKQKVAARNNYNNLAGENEARNVQERMEQELGPETPPWATPGYLSQGQQVVRFWDRAGQPGAATVRVPLDKAGPEDFTVIHLGGRPVDEMEELEEVPPSGGSDENH